MNSTMNTMLVHYKQRGQSKKKTYLKVLFSFSMENQFPLAGCRKYVPALVG